MIKQVRVVDVTNMDALLGAVERARSLNMRAWCHRPMFYVQHQQVSLSGYKKTIHDPHAVQAGHRYPLVHRRQRIARTVSITLSLMRHRPYVLTTGLIVNQQRHASTLVLYLKMPRRTIRPKISTILLNRSPGRDPRTICTFLNAAYKAGLDPTVSEGRYRFL